ncbi:MAG: hypothetical protein ACKOEC_05570, partial [Acidimicrobiia bacterium]
MVALLLLTVLQATPPATTTPAPASAAQAPKPTVSRPRPAGGPTTTALLFITNGAGRAIEGVTVSVMGPVDREVKSPDSGATLVEGLRAGTYRVRFTHDKFITFEKEIVWRAGAAAPEMSVMLNAAPEPPPPPPPAPAPEPVKAAEPVLPPPSAPKTVSLPDYIEKHFITGREPQKENLIGCSGVGQALLWQIREPWNGRQHAGADGMVYVVGGEGRLRLAEREFTVSAGAFAVVPRGAPERQSRRGRAPVLVQARVA